MKETEMYTFFKQQLKNLEINRGLKQYERMLEKDDWEKEIDALISGMCRVCLQFDEIPNKEKKRIIENNVITDTNFIGFNAGIIYQWLARERGKFFQELQHRQEQKSEEPKPILEGAAREAMLQKWLSEIADGVKAVPQLSTAEIKREGKIEVEKKATGWVPEVDPAEWTVRDYLHKQYVKENYHIQTGEKLSTWISEEEWLKKKESEV
jgi:hypothetical protein